MRSLNACSEHGTFQKEKMYISKITVFTHGRLKKFRKGVRPPTVKKPGRPILTARRFLVCVVVAVFVPVAQLRFVDALGPFVRPALGAQIFTRACRRRAVQLVGTVVTVRVPVALVIQRDAQSVSAPELAHVTRGEICEQTTRATLEYGTEKPVNIHERKLLVRYGGNVRLCSKLKVAENVRT